MSFVIVLMAVTWKGILIAICTGYVCWSQPIIRTFLESWFTSLDNASLGLIRGVPYLFIAYVLYSAIAQILFYPWIEDITELKEKQV